MTRRDDARDELALRPRAPVARALQSPEASGPLCDLLAITGTSLVIAGLTMHGTIRLVRLVIVGAGALIGNAIRQLPLDTPIWVNTLPYLCVGGAAVVVLP